MYKPSSNSRQASLFWDLETMLDSKHPLFRLANAVDWSLFEKSFAPLFCADNGRPPKPIRLMTGLLILKHLRNVSDEQVVAQFTENAYYQYFCGLDAFSTSAPCASSELVHFRHRIGEEGMELILKESIRVNLVIEDRKKEENDRRNGKDGRGRKRDKEQTAFIDSTVQEKNVTFPTDSKLLNKITDHCHKVAKAEGIKARQSYAREIKCLKLTQRFRGKSHSRKKVARADRRMRTIAGRLVRELLRELPSDSKYREHLELCLRFVNGELLDGHKIYSLHESDVLCICKGKEHKKYEFGNKVSIVRLWNGIIIGAMAFRNEYDGHTIDRAREQAHRLYGRAIRIMAGDRGYRGQKMSGDTKIMIPAVPKASDSAYMKARKHELFRKRAGIEPVIGHCKSDHRLGRNFYKGLFGDSINVMLAAAAYNLKRAMRLLLCLFRWGLMRLMAEGKWPSVTCNACTCAHARSF
ncbi:MAG: IS5 family transposase [Prevotellaceae bacterium]|nr:IS5 family transposase [Prevotellaceae bacterium]